MASNDEDIIETEPSKLKFDDPPETWTEFNEKRYDVLAAKFRLGPKGLTSEESYELIRLNLKKSEILKTEERNRKEGEIGELFRKIQEDSKISGKSPRKAKTKPKREEESQNSSGSDYSSNSDEQSETTGSDSEAEEASKGARRKKKKKETYRGLSQSRSDSEEETLEKIEKTLGKLIDRRFYQLVDDSATNDTFGQVKAPRTGKKKYLTEKLEKRLRNIGKNLYFGDRLDKSHPLKFILSTHAEISTEGKLSSKASSKLLLRLLKGQAFQMASSLLDSEASIKLIYENLQRAFSDQLEPIQAARALENFLESPNLVSLSKVVAKILELSSLSHALEGKGTRPHSISVTATMSLTQFLSKHYPRPDSAKVKQSFLRWRQRNPRPENPLETFFKLSSIAQSTLEGVLPSYARLGVPRPNPAPPGNFRIQDRRPERVEELYDDFERMSHISHQDIEDREMGQDPWETGSVLAADENGRPKEYICLLCGQRNHGKEPGLWKLCDVYRSQVPVNQPQGCCGYRHQAVPICRTPHPRPGHNKSLDRRKDNIQVYT